MEKNVSEGKKSTISTYPLENLTLSWACRTSTIHDKKNLKSAHATVVHDLLKSRSQEWLSDNIGQIITWLYLLDINIFTLVEHVFKRIWCNVLGFVTFGMTSFNLSDTNNIIFV